MAVISDKLESSLDNSFFINLFCHFEAIDKGRRDKFFNNSIMFKSWEQILEKPSATLIRVEENFKFKDHQLTRTISVSKCNRNDLKHPFHLNVYNNVNFDLNEKNTLDLFTHKLMVSLLNESVERRNLTLKTLNFNV